ncbi:MAG TPA: hypothetical protein VK634_17110 [Reyranella sp.]|nr:hypothetical protein [Reyranella sp.]HTE82407.1 hypothetical protein [Reyranella sp.]
MPGETADRMREGIMCESCGEHIDDDLAPGHPRRCAGCQETRDSDGHPPRPLVRPVSRPKRHKRIAGGAR